MVSHGQSGSHLGATDDVGEALHGEVALQVRLLAQGQGGREGGVVSHGQSGSHLGATDDVGEALHGEVALEVGLLAQGQGGLEGRVVLDRKSGIHLGTTDQIGGTVHGEGVRHIHGVLHGQRRVELHGTQELRAAGDIEVLVHLVTVGLISAKYLIVRLGCPMMVSHLHTHVGIPGVELQVVVGLRCELRCARSLVVADTQCLEIVHTQNNATRRRNFEGGQPLRIDLGKEDGSEHRFHVALRVSGERSIERTVTTLHYSSRTFAVVHSVVDGHFNVIGIFLWESCFFN